jgi:two-component system NtrC family response regulator
MTHVLVVEDEPAIAALVQAVLAKAGHEVESVLSGEEAIHRIEKQHFDVLLVDRQLPGVNGMAVIETGRQLQPEVAAILMTAHPEGLRSQSLRLDGYLAKPFRHIQDVVLAVNESVERRRATRQREQMEQRLADTVRELRPTTKT